MARSVFNSVRHSYTEDGTYELFTCPVTMTHATVTLNVFKEQLNGKPSRVSVIVSDKRHDHIGAIGTVVRDYGIIITDEDRQVQIPQIILGRGQTLSVVTEDFGRHNVLVTGVVEQDEYVVRAGMLTEANTPINVKGLPYAIANCSHPLAANMVVNIKAQKIAKPSPEQNERVDIEVFVTDHDELRPKDLIMKESLLGVDQFEKRIPTLTILPGEVVWVKVIGNENLQFNVVAEGLEVSSVKNSNLEQLEGMK